MKHSITVYFICHLECSCLCYEEELDKPWWSSSLHAVHHFHLTAFEGERRKIDIEVVKTERRRPSQTGGRGAQKDPHLSIIIKGYLS